VVDRDLIFLLVGMIAGLLVWLAFEIYKLVTAYRWFGEERRKGADRRKP
jgi:hypothetical protein